MSVGDGADDGEPGERDDVQGDVEQVTGGSGPDVLSGLAGAQSLDGGPGDDSLDGGAGPDALIGGDGTDTVSYASRSAGVSASIGQGGGGETGEDDRIAASVENLTGGSGPDTLTGSGASPNVLVGGAGDDTLHLRDGTSGVDRGFCGEGSDVADGDPSDQVAPDCEKSSVDGRQVRPAAVLTPRAFLDAKVLFTRAGGVVRVPVRCSAQVGRVCAGRLRLAGRPGVTSPGFGAANFRIAPGAVSVLEIRLTPRTQRRVRAARKAGIGVVAHLSLLPSAGPLVARDVNLRVRQGANG